MCSCLSGLASRSTFDPSQKCFSSCRAGEHQYFLGVQSSGCINNPETVVLSEERPSLVSTQKFIQQRNLLY